MTTKNAALFCLLVLPFGAIVAAAPCRAQTKPAVPFAPPQKPSPEDEEARKEVETFRDVFNQFLTTKGATYAVRVMYSDKFVMAQPDGTEITKAELLKQIAEGKQFQNAEASENELKAKGGKTVPLPKDKQTWRPDRYEMSDDYQIFAYTSQVQKTRQKLPIGKDGKLIDVELKILSTMKSTYERSPAIGGKFLAKLTREEIVGTKTYINGKEQPAGVLTGDAPPKL